DLEPLLGDGAAAVAVAAESVIAELVSAASVSEEFTYLWRTDEQRTVRASEPRFGTTYGYARDVSDALTAGRRRAERPPSGIAKVALGAPDPGGAGEAAKRAGFEARQVETSLVAEAGILGSAEPLALLSRSLEQASPGDFLVLGAYG